MVNHSAKLASKPAKPQGAAPVAAGTAFESEPNSGSKQNSLLAFSPATAVTAQIRRAMIAEAAYYIAEQRGFGDGREVEDWLIAERQIDAVLAG